MANYVYVENGEIKSYYDSLPKSWSTYSNFDALSSNLDFLKTLGWYAIVKTMPAYDEGSQKLSNCRYTFDGQTVSEEWDIVSIDPPIRADPLLRLRNERNRRLDECDWTQFADVQAVKSDEWKLAWKEYRQKLRDFPSLYENDPSTARNFRLINWPTKPNE